MPWTPEIQEFVPNPPCSNLGSKDIEAFMHELQNPLLDGTENHGGSVNNSVSNLDCNKLTQLLINRFWARARTRTRTELEP